MLGKPATGFVARRYDTRRAARFEFDGDRLARVSSVEEDLRRPLDLPWIAPGFVDLQVNGLKGQEFSSLELTSEKVAKIVQAHFSWGVTRLCPTLTTQSFDCLSHGMSAIDAACRADPWSARAIAGIHLEGPYFSTEDGPRGAHPREHCRRPSWDEFEKLQWAAGGRIRILTMSVEFEESPEFIAQVTRSGVVVAIGHTGASGPRIAAAVEAGARLSTHLGNGAHRVLPRHPNYIWDQLAEDRLTASLIVDGAHLPPEVVKTMVRAKSPARVILVSDLSGLAGLPVGRYASSGGDVEILPDGRLVIAGQTQLLAGASRPIGDGVANVMRFAGVDLATAIEMASVSPAKLIGAEAGGLGPGAMADLVLFRDPPERTSGLEIVATISGGRIVHGVAPESV